MFFTPSINLASSGVSNTYATFDPLKKGTNLVLSSGNLAVTNAAAGWETVSATIGKTSGKWYWEMTVTAISTQSFSLTGVALINVSTYNSYLGDGIGHSAGAQISAPDQLNNPDFTQTTAGNIASAIVGDIIGFALDAGAGKIWYHKNGTYVGNDTSGAEKWLYDFSEADDTIYPATAMFGTGNDWLANFGATPFSYSVPAGFNSGVYV